MTMYIDIHILLKKEIRHIALCHGRNFIIFILSPIQIIEES